MQTIEELWEHLLSEDPAQIIAAWNDLTPDEHTAVLEHLHRMSEEDGWHPLQKQSAATALRVISEQ